MACSTASSVRAAFARQRVLPLAHHLVRIEYKRKPLLGHYSRRRALARAFAAKVLF